MLKAAIITIGDEILVGQTIDTNSAWISSQLKLLGIPVVEILSISDKENAITDALWREMMHADFVFVTGGLGPTKDDITKKVLTEFFKDELVMNTEVLNHIESYFASVKRPMLEVNRLQAMLPSKARIILNDLGTASGMWFTSGEKHVISMPGVPYEMKGLMEKILAHIKMEFQLSDFYHRTIHFQGIPESYLADQLKETELKCEEAGVAIAYLPSPGIVKFRLTGTTAARDFIDTTLNELSERFKEAVFGSESDTLEGVVGELLRAKSQTVSTVESCTGGALSARIVSIPGSSDYYQGSIISYANYIKSNEVGVAPELLEKHGAVSREVVEQMAENGRLKLNTSYCIATSGIAGPDGGSTEKPVGTVWIAVASQDGVKSKQFLFKQNRERTIEMTVIYALNFLRKSILNLHKD